MSVATSMSPSRAAPLSWSDRDSLRIRLGTLCLLAAALAELIGILYRGPLTSPGRAPALFMAVSASSTLHLGWGLLLSAQMLECVGWVAVYCWLRDSAEERWAFWGALFAIAALIVFLPVWGAFGLTSHEATLAEQAGQHGAAALVAATSEGPMAKKFLIVAVLSALIAVGIWSRVFWRVAAMRWLVPLLILHTITESVTAPMLGPWGYRLERLGALAYVLVCAAIARRIWRDLAAARAGAASA